MPFSNDGLTGAMRGAEITVQQAQHGKSTNTGAGSFPDYQQCFREVLSFGTEIREGFIVDLSRLAAQELGFPLAERFETEDLGRGSPPSGE